MKKFKVGDRVVIFSNSKFEWAHDLPIPITGTITGKDSFGDFVIEFEDYSDQQYIYGDCFDSVELESIYNSPLNKALR